jgi:hypothetical protein
VLAGLVAAGPSAAFAMSMVGTESVVRPVPPAASCGRQAHVTFGTMYSAASGGYQVSSTSVVGPPHCAHLRYEISLSDGDGNVIAEVSGLLDSRGRHVVDLADRKVDASTVADVAVVFSQ